MGACRPRTNADEVQEVAVHVESLRGHLPLRLARQPLSGPRGERISLEVADMRDRAGRGFAREVAGRMDNEAEARRATSLLYYVASAVTLSWEGGRIHEMRGRSCCRAW